MNIAGASGAASIPLVMSRSVSNNKLVVRIITATFAFGVLGLLCGYFGPLYLLKNPGVGPLTGLFLAPIGGGVGGAVALWATAQGHSGTRYAYRLLAAALLFATAVVGLVVWQ